MARLIVSDGPCPVGPGTRVTLHFAILLANGEEVDGTRRGQPATFEVGDGSLLPGFERALFGLLPGDDAQLPVPAAEAFGPWREENLQRLPQSRFGGMSLEPGLLVSFAAADGELPGIVKKVSEGLVEVDFNHPLAGRDLTFDVTILAVAPIRPEDRADSDRSSSP